MNSELVIADWKEQPFTDHKRRHETVHHRIRVITYDNVGVDVLHEVCRQNNDKWEEAEVYEARDNGINRITRKDEWWAI